MKKQSKENMEVSTKKEEKRKSKNNIQSNESKKYSQTKKMKQIAKTEKSKKGQNVVNPIYKEKKSKQKDYLPMFKTVDMLGLVVLTCLVSLCFGYFFGMRTVLKSEKASEIKGMDKIIDTFNDIKENYYEDVKNETLINGAISGMLNSLGDPYSMLIDTSSNSFDVMLEGSYEGIGIEVFNNENGEIEILKVFDYSPASEAGLQKGDLIIKLNKKNVRGKSTSDLVSKIKNFGKKQFTLTVLRGDEELEVTIKRDNVEISSVSSKVYTEGNKKIGYISIDIFAISTYKQFKNELQKLEKKNIDSLIIDVRGNNGGHLSTVSDILSLFLDKSHVIYQTQKKDQTNKFYSTGKITKTYPIVVLTDGSSASASELLTATLKEEYGAVSIGKTTYGKGTVQELKDIDSNEYKFTTKKWLTPKGNWVNDIGVSPDIEVDLSEEYASNPCDETDNQLQKALEYLQNK